MSYDVAADPLHALGKLVGSQKEVWQTCHTMLYLLMGCLAISAASPVPCSVALVDHITVTVPVNEFPTNIAAHLPNSTIWLNLGILDVLQCQCYGTKKQRPSSIMRV